MGYTVSASAIISRSNCALLINVVAFQVAWVVNITGSAGLGLMASTACLAIHFMLLSVVVPVSVRRRWKEVFWIFAVVGFGWVVETALLFSSVLVFDETVLTFGGVPIWLLLIWACFATTFHLSMRFFVNHLWWASAAGTFALLSYASGVALNPSASFGREATVAAVLIACLWAVVFPVMCACYRQFWEKGQCFPFCFPRH